MNYTRVQVEEHRENVHIAFPGTNTCIQRISLPPKQQLLAELYEKQKCDVLCVQETHRGLKAIRPNIRGMSLVAEIPHEQ